MMRSDPGSGSGEKGPPLGDPFSFIDETTRMSLPLAAWVVQACGVVGNIARRAAASLFNGADGFLGTVRELIAVEYERLLEANEVGVVPAGKGFGFDLVEPPIGIEHRDRRTAAVRPEEAELTSVNLVDAVGKVDFHLVALRQHPDRMVDDRAFGQARIGEGG